MLLHDRVAVITGAGSARGIGYAAGQLFAEHGAKVVLADVNGAEVAAQAAALGAPHLGLVCDVCQRESCEAAIAAVLNAFGRIDILINNAGVTQRRRTLEIEDSDYSLVLDVNLRGGLHMSQAVLPAMTARNSGSIVFIASVSGQNGGGIFGGPHYSASKAAVIGLAKSMAREFGPAGVRVNSVAPGVIDTDISKGRRTSEERQRDVAGAPIARLGTAREVASACLFLASDLSSYTTGSVIDVNGGFYMR